MGRRTTSNRCFPYFVSFWLLRLLSGVHFKNKRREAENFGGGKKVWTGPISRGEIDVKISM